jgi:hypothetical protein
MPDDMRQECRRTALRFSPENLIDNLLDALVGEGRVEVVGHE